MIDRDSNIDLGRPKKLEQFVSSLQSLRAHAGMMDVGLSFLEPGELDDHAIEVITRHLQILHSQLGELALKADLLSGVHEAASVTVLTTLDLTTESEPEATITDKPEPVSYIETEQSIPAIEQPAEKVETPPLNSDDLNEKTKRGIKVEVTLTNDEGISGSMLLSRRQAEILKMITASDKPLKSSDFKSLYDAKNNQVFYACFSSDRKAIFLESGRLGFAFPIVYSGAKGGTRYSKRPDLSFEFGTKEIDTGQQAQMRNVRRSKHTDKAENKEAGISRLNLMANGEAVSIEADDTLRHIISKLSKNQQGITVAKLREGFEQDPKGQNQLEWMRCKNALQYLEGELAEEIGFKLISHTILTIRGEEDVLYFLADGVSLA